MRADAVLAVALALALVPASASAHGREPSLGMIAFDPNDPDHVVIRTTWGFITTRDHGETFTWQCAAGVPFDRTREDPSIAMTRSSSLLASTFDGVFRSDATQCAWSAPPTAPSGAFVTDVIVEPGDLDVAWAIASPGTRDDEIHRSEDEGLTWALVATPHPDALTDRIRVAPSDPTRVYTSGVIPRTATEPATGIVLTSTDRGMTWTPHTIALVEGERTIHVLAIDPTDADRLFARVLRAPTDTVPERILVSEDAGATWTTALEILEVTGFAMSADGTVAWAGSWDGGFHRSDDGGRTWSVVDPELRVRCLAWRASASPDGELWVCADGFSRGFALGLSEDGGDTIAPLWVYWDTVNDVGCDPSTPVGMVCPMYWPDLVADLQLDAGGPAADAALLDGGVGMDGSTEPPRPAGGCSCRATGSRRVRGGALAIALISIALAGVRGRCSGRPAARARRAR